MTVYDVNRAAYKQQRSLYHDEVQSYLPQIIYFLNTHCSNYYMLLNNELHYYTTFVWTRGKATKVAQTLLDTVEELGAVRGIEFNGDTIEFWIYDPEEDLCCMYPFFDYQKGVIEV